ncbi:hypothetical protein CVT25_000131 [Psilocybe cyanescens]|uniref:Uncharacterized protein n=1 Tax=Psilocybe cyanescens TaxID=93625 RepID=A0A409XQ43_PSICY|nr:hypothetical protein CVT25_000131 [Psilocybe cyanescens]
MVLTELEVVTLAFAALTMVIYGLWWNKPLDVQVSVPVQLKKGYSADPDRKQEEKKRETAPRSVAAVGEDDDGLQTSLLEAVEQSETPIAVNVNIVAHPQPSLLESKTPVALNVDVEAQHTSERSQSGSPEVVPDPAGSHPYDNPSLSLPQQFRVYLRAKREELGLIRSIVYVFTIRPGIMLFRRFKDMMVCTTLEGKRYRVPTFYAPTVDKQAEGLCFMLSFLVATAFGGIHCIAWSFEFPTHMFFSLLVYLMERSYRGGNWDGKKYSSALVEFLDNALTVIFFLSTVLYIAARGVLLILPLIGLRALPAGAYIDLNWTSYLPHV